MHTDVHKPNHRNKWARLWLFAFKTLKSQVFFILREFAEQTNELQEKKKKMCPHASRKAHTKMAIFQKKPTWLESRQDCGMKTCGSKSTADWISWLRRMKGIWSFVTWFSIVTEWAFSSCPDCRPLRLSKTEATAFIQGRLGHHDSSIFRGILNYSSHSTLTLRKWQSWEWGSERQQRLLTWQFVIITVSLQSSGWNTLASLELEITCIHY